MANEIVLDPPVRGEWAILNPPGHPSIAYDFLAVDERKMPYNLRNLIPHIFGRIPVVETYAWEKPIFSPCGGEVLAVGNDAIDSEKTGMLFDLVRLGLRRVPRDAAFSEYGGNYVIIGMGNVFVLLAHFRRNSIKVRVGEKIESGTFLGLVGNSGSSIQPHLHIQVMRTKEPLPLYSNLLEFKFRYALQKTDGEWQERNNFIANNGAHFLFKDF